ncbi:MAG: hypothetical protein JW994_05545 [Candidatus Omnitrophica bacterium]|nr:hypothetical protein [Candidatus Omnitrophota bacterium]
MLKEIGKLISILGIFLFIYSFAGRFTGGTTIGLGFFKISAKSGLIFSNGVMLIGLIFKQFSDK